MIRQFCNTANSDTFRFARFELYAILVVYTYRLCTLFVTTQSFIMQGMITVQVFYFVHGVENVALTWGGTNRYLILYENLYPDSGQWFVFMKNLRVKQESVPSVLRIISLLFYSWLQSLTSSYYYRRF